MKAFPILILLLLTVACRPGAKKEQVLDFGAFTLKAPTDWSIVKRQGIDSYVGGLTNGNDSLWFDYGRYGVDLNTDSGYWCRVSEDTVNGLPAIFSVPDSAQHGDVSMKIPSLPKGGRFTIWASKVKEVATVLQIYRSAIFRGSDLSKNKPLADLRHFERTNVDGKAYFLTACSSCHRAVGHVEGPTVKDLLTRRNAEWLYKFFTGEKARASDKLHQGYKREFNNVDCMRIPGMTREAAVAVFYYIKSQPY